MLSYQKPNLPIPPREVLERFDVQEPLDTRFQSCARLLQAVWRGRKGFAVGSYSRGTENPRILGSRLDSSAARAGVNYLRPDIAKLVRREMAYRERGALIDEARAWENLLSSSALVFNLFGPMKLDLVLAKKVLKAAFGIDAKQVEAVHFETSPGRGDDAYIGDHTALDVLIAYTGKDAKSGFIGIEVKYSESRPGTATPVKERHLEVARRSKLFVDPDDSALHQAPLRQFYAEHTLCYSMVHERRHFDRGAFVVVSPTLNHEMAATIETYRRHLDPAGSNSLPFGVVSLESIVAAISDAGETDLARKLDERYLDLSPIFDLIDDWEPQFAAVS
ncbi:hypothetical protein X760_27835 [Mesorhizobium sp. LSHC422A00]|uniref:PGN_0703 family putative restriction endonuclease n=1 Tax=Mesorhizobium sp. LSHC422A00 TaxID=1287294 RepID=UPI0003CEED4C|nr:hypothetical protein [Mesorhizobium sp. LSHC422A00]ESX54730.1 hypothetical protein X760_27835 [Mesorhizobium sp. LSHC422A00]